jgi:prepilin-type N-terminal cleavage/methylation domain-containing protein
MRRSAGMTLVEIMITLIISSIIAASTFMFFSGQQRVYETQTKILNIQQNLWASMEVLARYVRGAGSGMYECVRPADYSNTDPTNPNSLTGGRLQTTTPSDGPHTSGGVLITSLATRPQTGLRAFDGASGMQWIPPLWIVNNSSVDANVVPGTDIITVAFGNRASGADVDGVLQLNVGVAETDPSIPITLTGATAGSVFRLNECLLLMLGQDWGYGNDPSADRGCTLLQVTNNPGVGNILWHASGAGVSAWNPTGTVAAMLPPGGGYTGGVDGVRNFGALTWVRFFIQNDPNTIASANPVPQLMMQRLDQGVAGTAQALADGIEDLQVSFACDVGTLGTPNLNALNGILDEGTDVASRKNDEWINNVPGDVFPTNPFTLGFCNMPTAVRLTLVARSTTPDDLIDVAVTNNQPEPVEDNPCAAAACPKDQYRRRVLSTTVYPRNNKPL